MTVNLKKPKTKLENFKIRKFALTAKPAGVPSDDNSDELGARLYLMKSEDAESIIEAVTKSITDEFNLDGIEADIQDIERKQQWEDAWVEFKKKYEAGKFTSYWRVPGEYDSLFVYHLQTPENSEHFYIIRLLETSGVFLGIEFWMGYSEGKSLVRAVGFDKSLFTFETAQWWIETHRLNVTKGGNLDMDFTLEQLDALMTKRMDEAVTKHLEPMKKEIADLKLADKKVDEPAKPKVDDPISKSEGAGDPKPPDKTEYISKSEFDMLKTQLTELQKQKQTSQVIDDPGLVSKSIYPNLTPFQANIQKSLNPGYNVKPLPGKVISGGLNELNFVIEGPNGYGSGKQPMTIADLSQMIAQASKGGVV